MFCIHLQKSLRLTASAAVTLLVFATIGAAIPAMGQDEPKEGSDAVALFNQGQDHHEKGDLKRAIEFYERSLAVFPDFPEAELQRGTAYAALKQFDKAAAAFRRAVELKADWSLALAALGSLLVQVGEDAEAEQILKRAVELDGANFPAWSALTELRLKANAPPDQLREMLAAITAHTSKAKPPPSIWAARSALERALGDHRAASASAERALTLDPANVSALSEAALSALAADDPARAEMYIDKLEKQQANPTDVKLLRARAAVARNQPERALDLLRSIQPADGRVTELIRKISAAGSENAAELEEQLAKNPGDPLLLGRLCTLFRRRDPQRALELCQRAAAAEPDNIHHAVGFGAALVQAQRYPDAVAVFRKLIEFAPDNFTVRANLATALFQMRRYSEAKVEFRWLLERQPDLTVAYYFLGVSHDNLAEYVDAMANYQEFLRRADPEKNKDEIDRIGLRIPVLERQLKQNKGKRNE